jgi:hypothetical protein
MSIPLSLLKWLIFASAAAWLLWLAALWQPARQVDLHTMNLLARASSRDWPAVEAMMAPDYRDAWGHDREVAIDEARKLFSHFFALQIVPLGPLEIKEAVDGREACAPVGVFGSGTAVAQAVIEEVRSAGGDTVFVWRKAGGWPWQWALAEVRHAELARRWPR